MYPTGYAGAMPYYYPTSQTYGPMEQPPGTVYYAADGTVYAPTAMFQSPSSGYSTDNGELGPLEGQLGAMSLNAGSNGSPAANVDGESSTEPPAGTSTPLLTYSTPAFRYYTSASGPYPQQLPSNVTYAQSQQPYSTAAYNAGGYSSAQPLFDAQYASAASTYQPPYQTSYTGSGAYPYASFASAYTATTSDGLYAGVQSTAPSQVMASHMYPVKVAPSLASQLSHGCCKATERDANAKLHRAQVHRGEDRYRAVCAMILPVLDSLSLLVIRFVVRITPLNVLRSE